MNINIISPILGRLCPPEYLTISSINKFNIGQFGGFVWSWSDLDDEYQITPRSYVGFNNDSYCLDFDMSMSPPYEELL